MPLFLTKDIADALCTVITLGFMQYNSKASPGTQKTEFQYSDSDLRKIQDHNTLAKFIKDHLRLEIAITQATSQSEMPCIAAKTKYIWNLSMAKDVVEDFWGSITKLAIPAQNIDTAPFGAYIGVMSTISTLHVIGPSALELYDRKYRIDLDGVAENYKNARDQEAIASEILNAKSLLSSKVKIEYDKKRYALPPPDSIGPNQLFHSYHGMIRAMVEKYPPNKEAVYLEIALGVNTSKVSSCIPCSMFMSANDMAATSTHLGRGDNWSIPSSCNARSLRQKWAAAINCHYENGLALCKDQFPKINAMKTALSGYTSVLPDIFLEALTFEAPFLDRMKKTFGIA